ncbi:7-carboxy-7-deazaguanine synthase [BD1-7 clade bacterium]|uniref:7-carboxy-7-deazaguanine synthase n=1 Tax=BD1-7 clade bacterium TaxID=2029982 RepID=A0A5S9QTT1_9GAMM|nr:7-carboxy-7-deazaguanine synthase [BD1-7 clade bacterium]CAA0122945.1 7-carboxy-7-deazaguanine synthase [BD1-7 clade bacterium]
MKPSAFWRITLDTNPDHCNLNCTMCEDHSPFSASRKERKAQGRLRSIMPKGVLETIIREAHAMGIREVIPSTMGEPLLYPHFDIFLDLCEELGLSLNLTTNGTFPSSEKHHNVEYWAKRIVPLASDVKISWNGATPETQSQIMLGTDLANHIENAKRFIAIRDQHADKHYCNMTMQLTFMRDNLEEIPQMLDMAISMGFDRLKGHQLWTHFDEIKDQNLLSDIRLAERWNQIVRHCNDTVASHNATADRPFKLDNFFELTTDSNNSIHLNGDCPFLGKEIWVNSSGRFDVCCAPDEQRKSLGHFGNIQDSSLNAITESPKYRDLERNYQSHDLCKGCNMRRPA